jgi:hypothetical protein
LGELKGEVDLRLTNTEGKLVYSAHKFSSGQPFILDFSANPEGIYLLTIVSKDQRIDKKLMINR